MAQARARVLPRQSKPASRPATADVSSYAAALKAARTAVGGVVWDKAGVDRIDLRNDDGTVLIGWADARVEAAVARAGLNGWSEIEAAERLSDLIPCAEAVGFRTDLQSALVDALLAARTITARDGAFVCDDAMVALGDCAGLAAMLERHAGEVAAVVVRPMDAPRDFLLQARRLTERDGVLLIFDESRTAFRVHRGGAQGLSGAIPDLTVLGPSLANGRPLAAVVGAMEPMRVLSRSGGRVSGISLAAACATLERVENDDSAYLLQVRGAEIEAEVEARLRATGADRWLEVYGDPTWSLIAARARAGFDARALEADLAAALYAAGVLSFGAHVPSLATGDAAVARLLSAYDAVLPALVARAEAAEYHLRPARSARI